MNKLKFLSFPIISFFFFPFCKFILSYWSLLISKIKLTKLILIKSRTKCSEKSQHNYVHAENLANNDDKLFLT